MIVVPVFLLFPDLTISFVAGMIFGMTLLFIMFYLAEDNTHATK